MIDWSEWAAQYGDWESQTSIVALLMLAATIINVFFFLSIRRHSGLFGWVPNAVSTVCSILTLVECGIAMIIFAATLFSVVVAPLGQLPVEPVPQRMERIYGVEKFVCEKCRPFDIPPDRAEASWVKDGKFEKGTILTDGTQVGLTGPDGVFLQGADDDH